MSFQLPKKQGFVRLSETEETRILAPEPTQNTNQLGKSCEGCKKYYDYMPPEEKYCQKCE